MKLENAIEKTFNNCNLIGENVNIYEQMYKYKVFKEMDEKKKDEIYNTIAKRLGFIS